MFIKCIFSLFHNLFHIIQKRRKKSIHKVGVYSYSYSLCLFIFCSTDMSNSVQSGTPGTLAEQCWAPVLEETLSWAQDTHDALRMRWCDVRNIAVFSPQGAISSIPLPLQCARGRVSEPCTGITRRRRIFLLNDSVLLLVCKLWGWCSHGYTSPDCINM